jgi:hypothetical protein
VNYFIITLADKQIIKVKTQQFMADIVRFFIGDFFSCHDVSGNGGRHTYKLETKHNGIVYCKQIKYDFHKIDEREFIVV